MEKKHIISLGGELASGKGTVSKILMERLNYTVYRNGDYFRKLAKESGMDVTTYDIKNVFKDLEDIAKEGKIDKVKRFLKYNKEVD